MVKFHVGGGNNPLDAVTRTSRQRGEGVMKDNFYGFAYSAPSSLYEDVYHPMPHIEGWARTYYNDSRMAEWVEYVCNYRITENHTLEQLDERNRYIEEYHWKAYPLSIKTQRVILFPYQELAQDIYRILTTQNTND